MSSLLSTLQDINGHRINSSLLYLTLIPSTPFTEVGFYTKVNRGACRSLCGRNLQYGQKNVIEATWAFLWIAVNYIRSKTSAFEPKLSFKSLVGYFLSMGNELNYIICNI